MDDLWKNLAIGLFAFSIVHGSLEQRARHDAGRLAREAFDNSGQVRTRVEARGLLGMYANDLYAVDVAGVGVHLNHVPFVVVPRTGWKGSIRHVRVHLTDFLLRGLPVRSLEADIPFVTYDLGSAFWKDRLVFRGAGMGTGRVVIASEGLRAFIIRKYEPTLSDVSLCLKVNRVLLSGKVTLLGVLLPFVAEGSLMPREGRYIDIVDTDVFLNGRKVSSQIAEILLQRINPVLDAEADLGLRGFFQMDRVEISEDAITIRGRVTLPKR